MAHTSRRLAAIVAADIAGYSRMVSADEDATIKAIRSCRNELLDPLIERYGGRVANTAGDSLLLEFGSAVDAVKFSIAMQSGVDERNAGVRNGPSLRFRIGVNVGDVLSNDGDLLGDGVNVAARLEQLADPGGILVSRQVADYVRGRIDADLHALGAKRLKNIPEPVDVFEVAPKGAAPARNRPKLRRLTFIAGPVALVLAGLGIVLSPFLRGPEFEPASEARMAFAIPDRPSIAVLPMSDLSDAQGDQALADGLTDDLITDLSKISGMFVIAGNTSFAYRDAEIARFAEELGVRYILTGTLRRTGDELRINLRLVDALSGYVVWADRYTSGLDQVLGVQSRLVVDIADAMDLTLPAQEQAEIDRVETSKVEARQEFQKGWALYARFNEDDNTRAITHFRRAVDLDPDYGRAYAALALVHFRPHLLFHWDAFLDDGETMHIGLARRYMLKAQEYETALNHVVQAIVRLNLQDWTNVREGIGDARVQASQAISLAPNDPEALIVMAWSLVVAGQPEEGLNFVRAAMRADPKYPSHYVLIEAAAQYALGNIERASQVVDAGLERDPQAKELLPMAASLKAQLGDRRRAYQLVERWHAGRSPAALEADVERYFFMVRWRDAKQNLNAKLKDGLRMAALSPDVTVAALRHDLKKGTAGRQRKAARALGFLGAEAAHAVPELIAALDANSVFVRKEAIIALGRIGPPAEAALPRLKALGGPSLVGSLAQQAVDKIEAAAEN